MKDYDAGKWGITFIFSLEGSVFPKAFICALPNALLAVGLWYIFRKVNWMRDNVFEDALSGVTVSQSWNAYNWAIGFLVSFRAQRAYSRWWEGGTLLQQARGEWFNAYSSLIAFCTREEAHIDKVRKFQKILSRLVSMLYASALMSIATEHDLDFEILDASGLSEQHLDYLRTQADKCEIIMQWIQRLIVDNMGNGVLPIPPPVLSRVFQELSRGIVNIHNVRKITEFQFPFPAAQMIVSMLMLQWCLTPFVAALVMSTPVWAFFIAFFPIFACWGINYLATEIEQPFGTDYNDMPLHFMQCALNTSIMSLLDGCAQTAPEFDEGLESETQVILPEEKVGGKQKFNFAPMRSVRVVTIQDPDQLRNIKRRFISRNSYSGQQNSMRSSMASMFSMRASAVSAVPEYLVAPTKPGDTSRGDSTNGTSRLVPPPGPGKRVQPRPVNLSSTPDHRSVASSVTSCASQNSGTSVMSMNLLPSSVPMTPLMTTSSSVSSVKVIPPPPDDTTYLREPTDPAPGAMAMEALDA